MLTSDLSVSAVADKIGYGFTILVDVFNTAKDFWGVFATYSQIAHNYAEFVKYVDLLKYISNNYNYPDYVRDVAVQLYETFANTDNPDWQRLNTAVLDSLTHELTADAFVLGFDVIVGAAALTNPATAVAYAIYQFVKALADLAGFDDRAQAIVQSHIFYAIADGSSTLLNDVINFTGSNYFEYEQESESIYIKYAVQLLQARIIGINNMKNYLLSGRFVAWFDKTFGWHIDNNDVKTRYNNAINLVYDIANYFGWTLSDQMPEKESGSDGGSW